MVRFDLVREGMKLKLLSEHGDKVVKVVDKGFELEERTFVIHVVEERYPSNILRLPVEMFDYIDKPETSRRTVINSNSNRKAICRCYNQLDSSYMDTCDNCGGIICPECNRCGCIIPGWDNKFEKANKV